MANILYNTAPAFRNTYFDDQGVPLIDGKLFSFKASDHGIPKAIYQSNIITLPATTPPAYSNPIILDSGASVGPLFYASDENYYLELTDLNDVVIATVDNWNSPDNTNPKPQGDDVDIFNFIINPDFDQIIRGKFEKEDLPASETLIALPEWSFSRSNTSAEVFVEFIDFVLGQTDVADTPKRYLHYQCGIAGSAEISKEVSFKINDVRSLNGQTVTFPFWAKSPTASQIRLTLLQNFGAAGSSDVSTNVATIPLSVDWTEHTRTFTIPAITGKTLGSDVGFLKIQYGLPLNQIAQIDLTKSQLNRGDTALEYSYRPANYTNQADFGIRMPLLERRRPAAGVKPQRILSYNQDGVFKWISLVPVGFIGGNPHPDGTVPEGWLACKQDVAYPSAHYEDLFDVIRGTYGSVFTTAADNGGKVRVTALVDAIVNDATAGTSGFTINIIQQGTTLLPEIFDITTVAATSLAGKYFTFSAKDAGVTIFDFYVWFIVDNTGTDPALGGGTTGIQIHLNSTDTAVEVHDRLIYLMAPFYFEPPGYAGYFLRGWDDGEGIDPDAATRLDRGDGVVGDNVGTKQGWQNDSHDHSVQPTGTLRGLPDGANRHIPASDIVLARPAGDLDIYETGTANTSFHSSSLLLNPVTSGSSGGNQTNGINKYIQWIIKY